MSYNRFGATAADIIARYPGTQASDYGRASGIPDATVGTAAIEDALDRYARKAAACLTEAAFNAITRPRGEVLKEHTNGTETSFTTTIAPIVAGSVHVWETVGVPRRVPKFDQNELANSQYTVTEATGTITYSPSADLAILASYDADVTNAAYSVPSMADATITGAAAELGTRLYFGDEQRWGLVEKYQQIWDKFCEMAQAGWLPDEVRFAQYANEPIGGSGVSSVRVARA